VVSTASPDGEQLAVYDVMCGGKIEQGVSSASIHPDPESDPFGHGDNKEMAPGAFQERDDLLARLKDKGYKLIHALAACGEYTSVYDVVYGHYDNFNHTDGKLIENKLPLIYGEPDYSESLYSYLRSGKVPPGALYYPRYKISTLSYALSDIELRILHLDLHLGPHQRHPKYRNR